MTEFGLDISLSGRGPHREPGRRESLPCGVLARCPTERSSPNTQRFAGVSSPGKLCHHAPAGSRFHAPAAKSVTSCPRQRWYTWGARPTRAGLRVWVVCVVSARSSLSVQLSGGAVGCPTQPAGRFRLRPTRTRVGAACLLLGAKPLAHGSPRPSSKAASACFVWCGMPPASLKSLRRRHLDFSCVFLCWTEFRHSQPRRRSGTYQGKIRGSTGFQLLCWFNYAQLKAECTA